MLPEATPRPDLLLAEDWTFIVFLSCFSLMAWSRLYEPGQLRRMMNSAFNIRLMRQEMREEAQHRVTRLVYFSIFCMMGGMVLYYGIALSGVHLPPDAPGLVVYIILTGSLALLYLGKAIMIRLVSLIAGGDFSLSEYLYSMNHLNQVAGLALIPFMLLTCYYTPDLARWTFAGAIVIFGALLVYRWLRGTIHALRAGVPSFYIFFYLCTLEILPLAVAAKAIAQ